MLVPGGILSHAVDVSPFSAGVTMLRVPNEDLGIDIPKFEEGKDPTFCWQFHVVSSNWMPLVREMKDSDSSDDVLTHRSFRGRCHPRSLPPLQSGVPAGMEDPLSRKVPQTQRRHGKTQPPRAPRHYRSQKGISCSQVSNSWSAAGT